VFFDSAKKCRGFLGGALHGKRFLRPRRVPGLFWVLAALASAAAPAFSADTLWLDDPAYAACGNVTINGVVATDGPTYGLVWDWGQGSRSVSWFAAAHRYSADGTYTVTVTAAGCNTLSETTTVMVENADAPGCPRPTSNPIITSCPTTST